MPIADLRTRMVLADHCKAEIVSAIKAAFDNKQLPDLENPLSHSGGPNRADCETNYNSVHFLVVEPDRSSPEQAFSACIVREGRCGRSGAGARSHY